MYFFAYALSGEELDELLCRGWRKFGTYYFAPHCPGCARCVPVRIIAERFTPTKSQRRILRIAAAVEVRFSPLVFREEIFEVYREHSMSRFGKRSEMDEFINTFYTQSCPSLQSEYYIDGMLFATGFLDRSAEALSSVYFVFHSDYSHFSPGILSVIKETEYAMSQNLRYYYMGYYIEKNRSMSYKNRFHPYEWYSWNGEAWHPGVRSLPPGEDTA